MTAPKWRWLPRWPSGQLSTPRGRAWKSCVTERRWHSTRIAKNHTDDIRCSAAHTGKRPGQTVFAAEQRMSSVWFFAILVECHLRSVTQLFHALPRGVLSCAEGDRGGQRHFGAVIDCCVVLASGGEGLADVAALLQPTPHRSFRDDKELIGSPAKQRAALGEAEEFV